MKPLAVVVEPKERPDPVEKAPPPLKIVVLAGQSYMGGVAPISRLETLGERPGWTERHGKSSQERALKGEALWRPIIVDRLPPQLAADVGRAVGDVIEHALRDRLIVHCRFHRRRSRFNVHQHSAWQHLHKRNRASFA